jgi:ribosomal protein L24
MAKTKDLQDALKLFIYMHKKEQDSKISVEAAINLANKALRNHDKNWRKNTITIEVMNLHTSEKIRLLKKKLMDNQRIMS